MAGVSATINWSAPLATTVTSVIPGDVLCHGTGSDSDKYVIATSSNRALVGGMVSGVSMDYGAAGGSVRMLMIGELDPSWLGTDDNVSDVTVDDDGHIVRGSATPRLGWSNADGNGFFNATLSVLTSGSTVSVDAFGAAGDADGSTTAGGLASKDGGVTAATDDVDAIEAAIRASDDIGGCRVEFGQKYYRVSRAIVVDRVGTILFGQGAHTLFPPTSIECDKRASGFRVGQGTYGLTVTGGDESGFQSHIQHMRIHQVARDSTRYPGDWTYATSSVTLSDADGANFSVGQNISVGAANSEYTLARLEAATTSGSATVDITGADDGSGRGMFVGQYLVISTAYPNPTRIQTVTAFSSTITRITMASNAADTLTGAVVKERGHLMARVTGKSSAGGFTTLTTDATNGEGGDLVAVDIRDASCGVDKRYLSYCTGLVITNFEGAGINNCVNGTALQNTNCWLDINIFTHSCRHHTFSHGQNAQAGCTIVPVSVQSREWAWVDTTQAGNTYIQSHADGGYAYVIRAAPCTIIGAYHETGTYSSFSSGTQSWGGTGSYDSGGYSSVAGITNRMAVGDPSIHTHQTFIEPDGNFLRFLAADAAGSIALEFRTLRIALGDVQSGNYDGLIGFARSGSGRRYPLAIGDNSPPAGFPKHALYLPQGFYMGCDNVGCPDLANSSVFFFSVDDEPTASNWDALSATTKVQRGSVMFITGKGTETCLALRANTTDLPGTVTYDRMGELIDEATTQTTNNTTTTADSYTIPVNTAVKVEVEVVAQRDDGSDMAWWTRRLSAFRDASAAPTSHAADTDVAKQVNVSGAAWTAVLDISGNDIRVRVTGDTGKTINWYVRWTAKYTVTP